MEKKEYVFIYNGKIVYKGFFKPYKEAEGGESSEVQIFAQGLATGLRFKGVKNPCIRVDEVCTEGETERNIVLFQR